MDRVPILGPAHARPVVRRDPVSMVGDHALQDVHGSRPANVVVNRAEDASGLDGHHPHAKLPAVHALDLGAKVDRGKDLHRNTLRRVCHTLGEAAVIGHGRGLGSTTASTLRLGSMNQAAQE